MSEITVSAWLCDACGHIWMMSEKYPEQCPKCRTRKWNVSNGHNSVTIDVPDSHKPNELVSNSHTEVSATHSYASTANSFKTIRIRLPKYEVSAANSPAHLSGCRCYICKPPR